MVVLSLATGENYFIPPAYGGSEGFTFRNRMNEAVEALEDGSLKVYPNPATNAVNVEIVYTTGTETPDQFTVLDGNGRLVYSSEITTLVKYMTINTSNWASGTYSYLLSSKGEKLKSGKIEVIH